MSNPHYTKAFDVLEGSSNRSDALEAEFQAVQAGFDSVEAQLAASDAAEAAIQAELTAGRQGQASLVANLSRYLSTFAAATGHLDMGGYLVRGAGSPLLAGDLANKQYVDDVRDYATGLSFASALPGQAGQAGKVVRTNGAVASWGNWWGAPVRLTPANNGLVLTANTTYELDSRTGAFGVTLPVMAVGDWIKLVDVGQVLATNNVTVGRNGQLIRNGTLDLICDVNGDSFELVRTTDGVIEQ